MADTLAPNQTFPNQPSAATGGLTLKREMYFPTMIYNLDLPDPQKVRDMNNNLSRHIYAWREKDSEGLNRSNAKVAGSWHSESDMAKRLEYAELVELIFSCAHVVFQDMGYDKTIEPTLVNMWANINPRHGYNRSHFHPNVLWSGVYYVQTPEDCGNISFFDPRVEASMIMPRFQSDQARKPQAINEISFAAVPGRIILFPAWLSHEVEANMSEAEGRDGDRISISFNIAQRQ